MLYERDTIAAVATPPGEGGVAVIRISGPEAKRVLQNCFRPAGGRPMKDRMLTFGRVLDARGEVLDEAMAVFLPAPRTYTREDVAEIQCHGGRGAPARVLRRVLETEGVRAAGPGEFTKRAFLNGRVDLSEAEAVMAVIQAGSEAGARAAARQLEGGVSHFVREAREKLEELLALVSAATDFPDEIDEDVTARRVLEEARELRASIEKKADPAAAKALREGVSIALCGKPNVGKSSLMNAAAGFERAIVSAIPGTTRDVLTERLLVEGIAVELSDTAGQREDTGEIEAIGVARARSVEERADAVILVLDRSAPLDGEDEAFLRRADGRYLIAANKMDAGEAWTADFLRERSDRPVYAVSAATGEGVEELLRAAVRLCGAEGADETAMTAARHIECAGRAAAALRRLEETVGGGAPLDLAAADLWEAMYALSEITGEDASEDVIDRVFSRFCVGK